MAASGSELCAGLDRMTLPSTNIIQQCRIVSELDAVQAEVDEQKRLQSERRRSLHPPLDALRAAPLLSSSAFVETGARASTPSTSTRSGHAPSLREIHLSCSKRARFRGHLVPEDSTDGPAARFLEWILEVQKA